MTDVKALLKQARSALVDGRWLDARRLLDQLGTRPHDLQGVGMLLATSEAYGVPEPYRRALEDRIRWVNLWLIYDGLRSHGGAA